MLDIRCYCPSLIEHVYEGEKPEKIVAVGHLNDEEVDQSVTASFLFKNGNQFIYFLIHVLIQLKFTGKTASMSANSKAKYPNEAVIVGQKGTIKVINTQYLHFLVSNQ